ncbi:UDP-2,4-diacetamido-2,4,6-trideoxy-beta-L-altropyranose hydrolase [Allofrancisella guangzhouensis]|uniref:UDP-2,4-diacetamido-2,4, 6-trideoxy-beta-L-altropyranose hydrolase n=1 Tax=Allofrancisella guangzhouensis TaxID=594679 RepID=UPI0008527896|nr:UDP-2,4-diacetamido-2,4,6-trideoxy-beta-L-altropyranose hydrolase [Allofrancisella guangzhouensis]MBK2043934.1 UDP-2,4-diacetamido-2,4,6-trideoxy-beta-L-altropyranose hydrolase [Allofrancisella guangzhouensis]MBK2044953.1 UDP-2,4-diacetamido-2,4,6-trideoxy-beta-L-altropyranose hydrolase [Allofrancisella guangzhouensis]
MKAIIRADSSSSIGTGHIMRDLVLATQFDDVTFVTRDLPGNINFKIIESGYSVEIIRDNSLLEFIKVVEKLNPDIVILDSYNLGYDFERAFKEKYPYIKLMVLDDTYERHYCDILLNHNISADENKYKCLVPKYCEMRCGSKYTLLRQEFYDYKNKSKPKNIIPKVFVAMGGADHSNINIEILRAISEVGGIEVNLVTTTANKNLEQLVDYCKDKNWVNLYINSTEIARLMHESDFAIVTPSVTVNEVCFMGLPIIAIKTADNQKDMLEYLKREGYDTIDGFNQKQLEKYIQKYTFGVELYNFTELNYDESVKVLSWRNDPLIRNNMYSTEEIKLSDHLRFIESLSNRDDKKYFVVRKENNDIGVVDFTQITPSDSLHMGLYAKPGVKGAGHILMNVIVDYSFKVLCVKRYMLRFLSLMTRLINYI